MGEFSPKNRRSQKQRNLLCRNVLVVKMPHHVLVLTEKTGLFWVMGPQIAPAGGLSRAAWLEFLRCPSATKEAKARVRAALRKGGAALAALGNSTKTVGFPIGST